MSLLKSTELYFYRGLYFGYSFPGFPRHDVVNVGLAAVDQEKDQVDESQSKSQPNTTAVVEFTQLPVQLFARFVSKHTV